MAENRQDRGTEREHSWGQDESPLESNGFAGLDAGRCVAGGGAAEHYFPAGG